MTWNRDANEHGYQRYADSDTRERQQCGSYPSNNTRSGFLSSRLASFPSSDGYQRRNLTGSSSPTPIQDMGQLRISAREKSQDGWRSLRKT